MKKLNLIKDKRGLERTVIVTAIIVIISFIILLGAVGKLGGFLPDTLNREVCRDSVFAKAAIEENPKVKLLFDLSPSLKCKTEYTCLHQGGKCPETGFDKKEVKNDEQLTKEIADSMFWCWWQLGEGKANFLDESLLKTYGGIGTTKSSCVICSVIKFDEFTKDKELDLVKFMDETKAPFGDRNYTQYFQDTKFTKLDPQVRVSKLKTDQDYAVLFMGMKGEKLESSVGELGRAGGTAFVSGSVARKLGIPLLSKAGALILTIPAIIFESTAFGSEIWNAHLANVYCDGESGGCFAMMLTPYNAQEIAAACNTIESIP